MLRPSFERALIAALFSLLAAVVGCGTTKQSTATEQLLGSDAVDRAVTQIDFSEFDGQKVFFNTEYIKFYAGKSYQGIGYVNSEYVISSLRQQMASAGCLLQDKVEDSDYVVEARIGTLGQDVNEIVYGIPANNSLAAASLVPGTPPLPAIPEISVARRKDAMVAAKIAAFAYHRESRRPVWQSGLALANSTARDTWILGAGPFGRTSLSSRKNQQEWTLSNLLSAPEPEALPQNFTDYSEPKLFEQLEAPSQSAAPAIAQHAGRTPPNSDKTKIDAKPPDFSTRSKN